MNEDGKRSREGITLAELNSDFWRNNKPAPEPVPDYSQESRITRSARFEKIQAETLKYMHEGMEAIKKKEALPSKEVKDFSQKQINLLNVLLKETPEFDETFVATINRLINSLERSIHYCKDFSSQPFEEFFRRQREELIYPRKNF